MRTVPGWLDPPLDPAPDEARSWLRQELSHPEYHRTNPLRQLLDWLNGQLDRGAEAAAGAPLLTKLVALLLFALFVVGLLLLISRIRLSRRAKADRPVLEEPGLSASELRRRAEAALAEGRHESAVVDGFRALTLRQVERRRLLDAPGMTAHEVAVALDAAHPSARADIGAAARLFDLVRYGDRTATAEQARSVLMLDDQLDGIRR